MWKRVRAATSAYLVNIAGSTPFHASNRPTWNLLSYEGQPEQIVELTLSRRGPPKKNGPTKISSSPESLFYLRNRNFNNHAEVTRTYKCL